MLSLNKNNLPDYLHAQSNQLSVVFENGVWNALNTTLNNIERLKNSGTIWDLLMANKIDTTLGVPTNLLGKVFENNINVYGNGNLWRFTIEYIDFTLVIQYNVQNGLLTLIGPPPKSLYQAQHLILREEIPYVDDITFVKDLFNECIRYSTLLTEAIDSIAYYGHKFLPEVYYSEYPNSIPVMAEKALTKIIDDVESFKINNWTDIKTVQKEFHFESVFGANSPILKIADSSLIKGLFAIKGTETGLRFILKYFNIEVVVFYAEDIKRLKLIKLPDHLITECDIIIDLTLGANASLGVKEDGTIDYDYDKNFKDLVTKVMSVCLNILAFTYTKRIKENWYADHPIQAELGLDEIDTTTTKYNFIVPDEYKLDCPDNKFYEIKLYGDPITYSDGYFYNSINKLLDPIDFGDKPYTGCKWIAQSRLSNFDILSTISSGICRDALAKYNSGYTYGSGLVYKNEENCGSLYTDNFSYLDDLFLSDTAPKAYSVSEVVDTQILSTYYYQIYNTNSPLTYSSGLIYKKRPLSDSINVLVDES